MKQRGELYLLVLAVFEGGIVTWATRVGLASWSWSIFIGLSFAVALFFLVEMTFWEWLYRRIDFFVYTKMDHRDGTAARITYTKVLNKTYVAEPGNDLLVRTEKDGRVDVYMSPSEPITDDQETKGGGK